MNSTNTPNQPAQRAGRLPRFWEKATAPHPSIVDIGERRRAQLLSNISLILAIPFILALLSRPRSYDVFIEFIGITAISYIFSRTRYFDFGSYIFTYGFTSLAFLRIYQGTANSIDSAVATTVHLSLIIASVLLSMRGLIGLSILSTLATFLAPLYSHMPMEINNESLGRTGGLVFTIGVVLIGINIFRASVERARLKELRDINSELEDIKTNLEQRVFERTNALSELNRQATRRASLLQAITELSEALSYIQDLAKFLPAVTSLISERFGVYHAGIFFVDQERQYAVLQAANSEGGQKMLARSHRLKIGTGVVGFTAQTGQPRIALDVGTDAVFFDNPDLPDTRSEVALPLKARGETVGVLDVQSTEAGAFSPEDLQVLTALANQVSIAFENARLLTETRSALTQAQEVFKEFTRTEWSRTISQAEQSGFRYQGGRIELIDEETATPEILLAAESGEVVANPRTVDKKRVVMAVPVKLRGEVIGVIHVESSDTSKPWDDDEIGLVEAVAERAAIAMENARLFQDARRRASKEQLISQATSRISNALSLENILQTTAEELERVLGGSEILIQFQGKERA